LSVSNIEKKGDIVMLGLNRYRHNYFRNLWHESSFDYTLLGVTRSLTYHW